MEPLEKKYRSLRIIAWFFKLGAWISGILGFVLFFAVLFGGGVFLHLVGGSPYAPYAEFGRAVGALLVLAGFLINALFFYALSSTIHLFIDIEANTRAIANLLEKSSSLPVTKNQEG